MGKVSNNNSNRRLRTPNWSVNEKQYLLELINARKEVVITKNNNGPNYSEEKDVAWHEILRELSLKFGAKFCGSSIKKVKTQWQNMKRIAREEIACHGPQISKLSRQTLDVCTILDMIKDGVVKMEETNLSETMLTSTNVEIKTERIDEDVQPSCSGPITTSIIDVDMDKPLSQLKANNITSNPLETASTNTSNLEQPSAYINTNKLGSSDSSISEQILEINDDVRENVGPIINVPVFIRENLVTPKPSVPIVPIPLVVKKNIDTMTEGPSMPEQINVNPFHKEMQDYFKFVTTEKIMKMESLKEERQVVRAMRETAELNKIIAEQKLKHVLWIKKQEMAMYSGEPGSGAGKGGGGGGTIREAGGTFGKMEAAREEEYFYKKQKQQLHELKQHLDKEVHFHEQQIKLHEDAIRRHKQKASEISQQKQ